MKKCRKCGEKKDFREFHARVDSNDGYRNDCKVCHKSRCESYRQMNLDRDKANKRAYFLKHREKFLNINKQWAHSNPEKMRSYRNKWKKCNPDKVASMRPDRWSARVYNARYKYGVEPQYIQTLDNSQNGCCAICKRHKSRFKKALHLDHCHKTGSMRGMLCVTCNTRLGKVKEDAGRFPEAREYLERYRTN